VVVESKGGFVALLFGTVFLQDTIKLLFRFAGGDFPAVVSGIDQINSGFIDHLRSTLAVFLPFPD
jgi:hypothetical protein